MAIEESLGPDWTGDNEATEDTITFGPRAQLPGPGANTTGLATTPTYDDPTDEQDASFMERAFIDMQQPVMTASPPTQGPIKQRRVPATAPPPRPKSERLAANKTTIPVAKRAQHRLVKELQFVAANEPVTDKAVTDYIKMYKQPLPAEAIQAIRKATRLNNKAVGAALSAVAAVCHR